jgi:iron complex transport system ATP-binding protein
MRLEARDLAFGYPGKPVGQRADLVLDAREVVCLLGPNGSGKTTLFKTMLGLMPPQGGGIWPDGQPLERLGRGRAARGLRAAGARRALPLHIARAELHGRRPSRNGQLRN